MRRDPPTPFVIGAERRDVVPSAVQGVLEALPDSAALLDDRGVIVAVNEPWRAFARANDGSDAVGEDYLATCARAAAEDPAAGAVGDGVRDVLEGTRASYACTYPCDSPDEERWFWMRAAPFPHEGRRWALVLHRDVSAHERAEQVGHEREQLLDAVGAAVIATDLGGTIRHWSDGAAALYGWAADEVLGRPITTVTVQPDDGVTAEAIMQAITADGEWEGEFDVQRRDGTRFPALVRNRLLRDADGHPRGFVGVSVDLTQRVEAEQRLRGTRDFLRTVTETMPDGLYVLDRDGRLTFMNEAAERLLGWRRDEVLGRVAHDVFHHVDAEGRPHALEDCPVTTARDTGNPVRVEDDVYQRRDGLLLPVAYAAAPFTSETGDQGWVVVFSDISERKAREAETRRELEELSRLEQVRIALDEDRVVLHAQPIVDLRTGTTVQHEVLVRIVDEDGALVPPGAFLPVAERYGLIGAIDRRVLEKALGHAAAGHPVEINVSADSLGDPSFLGLVADWLATLAVDPRLVVFEVTETALVEDEAAALAFAEGVRALGCAVALDDFGTGYGGFSYLKQLPVSVLKIDREFVRDLDGEDRGANAHVIRAIVSLAQGMGLTTVAEGIETREALAVLRSLGVDYGQGYLFARPAPVESVFTDPTTP